MADAVPDLSELADSGAPVYVGGPVAADSVIVLAEFDEPSLAGVLLDDDLGFVGGGGGDLGDVAGGVRRARVFAGHAGWGPGQLDGELEEESWIVEPPRREEIFSEDPERLWAAVLRRKGREYALLSTMPPDPSVNWSPRPSTDYPTRIDRAAPSIGPGREEYVPMPSDAHNFNYVESSIPEGMTLGEYRRARMNRQPKPVRKGPRWFPMPRVRIAYA